MKIEKPATLASSNTVSPRHVVMLACPACNRDIDAAELSNQTCNDCGASLEQPRQSVAIFATSQPLGGKVS